MLKFSEYKFYTFLLNKLKFNNLKQVINGYEILPLHAGQFFCRLQIFFKVTFFKIFFQEYHQCQPVWTQIVPDILLDLIWVQTVYKDYEETTLSGKQMEFTQKLKSLVLTIRTSVESPNPLL